VSPAASQGRDDAARPAARVLFGVGAAGVLVLLVGVWLLTRPDDSVRVVDPVWADEPSSGVVHYCSGKDISHSQIRSVKDFKNRFHGQPLAEFEETLGTAREQHDTYLDLLSEKSQSRCDVVYLDVPYMREFAQKNLLYDMSPYLRPRQTRVNYPFDERMMNTVRYDGRLWGVPKHLDAPVLFYRKDKVSPRPRTWQEVLRQAQQPPGLPGLRFQSANYEGLTVVFLELAYSAGAQPVISGKDVQLDQPPAVEALKFLRSAVNTAVPSGSIGEIEEGSRYALETGRALLIRSWSYTAARLRMDARTDEKRAKSKEQLERARAMQRRTMKIGTLPVPPWNDRNGRSVGILGGHDLVIPRNAAHPRAAMQLIDFLTSSPQVIQDAQRFTLFPVIFNLQSAPEFTRNDWVRAINATTLLSRPVLANYVEVSQAISTAVQGAMSGKGSVYDALHALDGEVQKMVDKG
jgi:multiple sugar transport system substrate-binding protein